MYLPGTLEAIGIKGAFTAFTYRPKENKRFPEGCGGGKTNALHAFDNVHYRELSAYETTKKESAASFYARAISTSRFVPLSFAMQSVRKGVRDKKTKKKRKKKKKKRKKEKTRNAFKQSRS